MRWALVVVDMQVDYCATDGALGRRGLRLPDPEGLARTVTGLADHARRRHIPIFWIRTEHGPATDTAVWVSRRLNLSDALTVSDAPLCRAGSPGAEFYGVCPAPGESVIVKHRYSAFIGTDLEIRLKAAGVTHLAVAGTATEVCVESTVRDAFQRDFYTVTIEDACQSPDPLQHAHALAVLGRYFGRVETSRTVLNEWAAS